MINIQLILLFGVCSRICSSISSFQLPFLHPINICCTLWYWQLWCCLKQFLGNTLDEQCIAYSIICNLFQPFHFTCFVHLKYWQIVKLRWIARKECGKWHFFPLHCTNVSTKWWRCICDMRSRTAVASFRLWLNNNAVFFVNTKAWFCLKNSSRKRNITKDSFHPNDRFVSSVSLLFSCGLQKKCNRMHTMHLVDVTGRCNA